MSHEGLGHRLRHLSPEGRPGSWAWAAAALALFVATGAAAVLLPTQVFVALLAGGLAVLAWLLWPEAVILGLLLVRSSIDGLLEVFTLFTGTPLSMTLSGVANSLAVGLGLLTLARRWLRRREDGSRRALLVAAPGWSFTLFLLAALLSIPGSVDPAGGVKEWARLASGLAIYLMVADAVEDERDARRFLVVIMASSLVPLAVALMQRLTGSGFFFLGYLGTEFAYRPRGTLFHPATLGSYLVLLLTLAAALYFSSPRPQEGGPPAAAGRKAVLLGWSATGGAVLALTLARTQWLGMVAAAMVLGLLKRRRLALLVLAVGLVLLWTVPLFRERLSDPGSTQWRLELWQGAVSLIWPPLAGGVRQALLGRGLATSPWHINQVLPRITSPPHNDYLKVTIEMGALGLLAYGAWLWATLRHAWRAYRQARERAIAWRGLALLAIVVAGMAMSISDNYLSYTAVQWYFWALVALVPADGHWPVRTY